MLNLTDLIKSPHLKFLGDVEFEEYGLRYRVVRRGAWYVQRFWPEKGRWMSPQRLLDSIVSCILEHAIRVKLAKSHCNLFNYWYSDTLKVTIAEPIPGTDNTDWTHKRLCEMPEPEALIAAMDALIEGKKDDCR